MKKKIKALTFDTGGTVLDWHSGFREALKFTGAKYGLNHDWAFLANSLRRKSMSAMLQLGEFEPPTYNFDDAHKFCLEEVLLENEIDCFSDKDLQFISYDVPHKFNCWSDFPQALDSLRKRFLVCSFTILSYRLIMDTAKHNGLLWDAVFSCEGIGKYKMLQTPYHNVVTYLQLQPSECLMVACHPWDLDAARKAGFSTAFVSRPSEWGTETPPWKASTVIDRDSYDIVADNFGELVEQVCG